MNKRPSGNPLQATFRFKSIPSHYRMVRCHRMDETPTSWACHVKVYTRGRKYVRHMTEWFEKSLWDFQKKGYRKSVLLPKGKPTCESPAAPIVETKTATPTTAPTAAPPASASKWAEENPALAAMHTGEETPAPAPKPKSPPPAITFADDDEDDQPVQMVPAVPAPTTSGVKAGISIQAEYPQEYNPRAHPKEIAGKIEDLVVFDDLVNQNFINQRRKEKLMLLQARRQGMGASVTPTMADKLGVRSGFEPG